MHRPNLVIASRLVQLAAVATLAACGADDVVVPNSGFTWPTLSPLEARLDTARLRQLDDHLRGDLPNANAFVLVRGGAIAWEWYHPTSDVDETYDTFSITKSAVATFVGLAMAHGFLTSLDQPITDFFPRLARDDDVDPRLLNATVRHLLTMTSGLEDELSQRVPLTTPDYLQALLRTPLLWEPGTGFQYDAANSHALSGIVTTASDRSLGTWATNELFPRLNITAGHWLQDNEGLNLGWTGLFLNAQDLAKLGELYLRDGLWMGERLLPAGFAELAAGTPAVALPAQFADYGLHWWNTDRYGTAMWIAAGFRHQYIVIMPALDVVAVLQSEARTLRGPVIDHFHIFEEYVLPAIQP